MIKKMIIPILGLTLLGCASDFYYNNGQKVEMTPIEETTHLQKRGNSAEPITYYKTSTGHKVGVTDKVLVECETDVNCTKILQGYGLSEIKSLSQTIFVARVSNGENIFELSNRLYEDGNISKAHPNFIKIRKRR